MSGLEEIIQYKHTTPKGRHYVGFKSEEDFKRFIHQAQKAEELQAKVEELEKELNESIKRGMNVSFNNVKYKQGLKFYADENIYEEDDENYRFYVPEIIHDNGETARQALKGVEG